MKHISTRLYLFGLVTGVLVPVLAFTGFLLTRYAANERARFERDAMQIAYHVSLVVDAQLAMLGAMLQGLASSSALAENDLAKFYREALQLVQGKDAVIVLRELGPRQILNTERPFGVELPPAIPIAAADVQRLSEGRSVVSGVYGSPLSGEPRIAVALPVRSAERGIQVLAITVPTTRLRDALLLAVPQGWIATVGDRNGIVVTRSIRHEEVTGTPGRPDYLSHMTGRSGTFTAIAFEGTRLLAGYYRSNFSDWVIGANIPEEVVAAPLWRSLSAVGLLGASAIMLSALLAYLFGTTFTSATSQLAQRAAALGAGKHVAAMSSPLAELESVGEALMHAAAAIEQRERERQLLINELDHRVKNTLAIVQSIVHQTLRAETSDISARQAITGRLVALAQTHDVLTRESWQGAELQDLVAQALRPYGERCQTSGPPIWLPPRLAVSLALALHELATNAVKYGSLSSATGRVDVAWELRSAAERQHLILRWTETGGPAVSAPTRQGFGTRLLQRGLTSEIGGSVKLEFRPEGLVCVLEAAIEPFDNLRDATVETQAPPLTPA
ncbi:MAG: sensor histidine kinase [Xanthobacteraceae bacterium]